MAEQLLDKLAHHIVLGLEEFFAHRVNNGEDPTACLQMFLDFLKSNREKSPQLFKKIASKIDSSFFAPLRRVNQIASPDDFIATYHDLVNKLIEINPQMPYRTDYEERKALIENENRLIEDRLLKEKEEKRRIVDNEYRRIISDREKEYKKSQTGRYLRISPALCFTLFVVLLLIDHQNPAPRDLLSWSFWLLFTALGMGSGWIFGEALSPHETNEISCGGILIGLPVAWGSHAIFLFSPGLFSYLVFLWPVLGVFLAMRYRLKVAALRFSPEERSAYNTSLDNIGKHFSDKERYEITQSTVKILTNDEQ